MYLNNCIVDHWVNWQSLVQMYWQTDTGTFSQWDDHTYIKTQKPIPSQAVRIILWVSSTKKLFSLNHSLLLKNKIAKSLKTGLFCRLRLTKQSHSLKLGVKKTFVMFIGCVYNIYPVSNQYFSILSFHHS